MKSPFVIKYKTTLENEYKDISNKRILSEFEYRFRKLHADNIDFVNDSKLSVRNKIIRLTPNFGLINWQIIGKAEIEIVNLENTNSRLVNFRYSYTRIFVAYMFLFLFLLISIMSTDLNLWQKIDILVLPGIVLFTLSIIVFSIVLIRYKTIFNGVIETIKFG